MSMSLIQALPKAELHLHIEGTLTPSRMMALAKKHNISLPYVTLEDIQAAYQFDDLQSFLNLYYQGADVLREEEDFFQLMWDYLLVCKEENIVHTEIMFDPQTHTNRGVGFDVFMPGFLSAIRKAKREWGQSTKLIMSFLRDLTEAQAFDTLDASMPYLADIEAVGLDSAEKANPPEKFRKVFAKAKSLGLKRVAHAGEEGPAEYIWGAINELNVARIDHGVRATEDNVLLRFLREHQIPLTVCPLSNIKLNVFDKMDQHNILSLLNDGLCVTVNSDDPSYFGGYLNQNYKELQHHLDATDDQIVQLIKNSFLASFLAPDEKEYWLVEIDRMLDRFTSELSN
ncbi:adenosine deaminase [Aestuariibacter sp. AA17]|uniref:Adenine deaminase n=1 Tax=Fluctibacter corallii TaxID=2984329 RepID=A0ABT3A6I4_9ALTE|nr:adenosine deaminase [Aestuariibacter sp. AA17]MCV2884225.1 adenosine deaminase [Aestuariibacter sp. AA17]